MIKTLTAVVLLSACAGAHAYCTIPSLPFGADSYDYERYHRQLEQYHRCTQREWEDQQQQLQNQQLQRNNNLLWQ